MTGGNHRRLAAAEVIDDRDDARRPQSDRLPDRLRRGSTSAGASSIRSIDTRLAIRAENACSKLADRLVVADVAKIDRNTGSRIRQTPVSAARLAYQRDKPAVSRRPSCRLCSVR